MALENFIPEIWSSQLLVNLHNDLVYGSANVINRDYQGEIANFGDTVRINSIGSVSISSYTKNVDHAAPQTLSDAQVVLNITEGKMFNFQVDDVDQAQQNPQVMGAAMREAGFALANVADGFVSGLIDAGVPGGNVVTTLGLTGTNDSDLYSRFVDLGVVLDENNAPMEGRWAVVSPAVYGVLLKDARFVSFGTGENRSTIANRTVGTVAGFTILVSNQTPLDGADPTKPVVLAGHNWATTYAEQILKMEAYRPELRFADAVKGLHVYGGKVVRPELIAKVVVDFAP